MPGRSYGNTPSDLFYSYRVNIGGFPNAAGLESQNLGLLDQRMA